MAILLTILISAWIGPLAVRVVFSRPPQQAALYGTYVADYSTAHERLILRDDGTFEQQVTLKQDTQVSVSRGSWAYSPKDGYITFSGEFMPVVDGFMNFNPGYASDKKGVAFLPAEELFGQIQFEGSGEGVVYKRIGPGG